jgi:hypothetical protein
VRLGAGEHDFGIDRREERHLDVGHVRGVDHHCGADALEQPVVEHHLLAREVFLGRRAEKHDLARQRRALRGQRERGADRGSRDDVVAAAVAEASERVVLGEDRDARSVAVLTSQTRADGGRQRARRVLHREPGRLEDLGDRRGRGHLLEARFRVGMDPVRQTDQHVAPRLDRVGQAGLQ